MFTKHQRYYLRFLSLPISLLSDVISSAPIQTVAISAMQARRFQAQPPAHGLSGRSYVSDSMYCREAVNVTQHRFSHTLLFPAHCTPWIGLPAARL